MALINRVEGKSNAKQAIGYAKLVFVHAKLDSVLARDGFVLSLVFFLDYFGLLFPSARFHLSISPDFKDPPAPFDSAAKPAYAPYQKTQNVPHGQKVEVFL
jgi:hypothetical protein